MSERDTHFFEFAKLLVADLERQGFLTPVHGVRPYTLIARRAYDLLYFLLDEAPYHSGSFDVGYGSPDEIHETIGFLPDLTAWPESEQEQ